MFEVGALFLILEIIRNNFLEPWLYGTSLGLFEISIILATVAWTFLWGPAGLVLGTPLTVCLVVIGEHVPALSFFSRLLAHRSVLSPHFQFYRRLLARDEAEAVELAQGFAKKRASAHLGCHATGGRSGQARKILVRRGHPHSGTGCFRCLRRPVESRVLPHSCEAQSRPG
jgi:hypothetical protein